MRVLCYVMGPTNAGKSTFLQWAANRLGERVALVEVGKVLRGKYPPSYFARQNNPAHVAEEAWQIFLDRIAETETQKGVDLVLIDGQPRDLVQTRKSLIVSTASPSFYKPSYIFLDASEEVRTARARRRFDGDPEGLDLAMGRMRGDLDNYVPVVRHIAEWGYPIRFYDSSFSVEHYGPRIVQDVAPHLYVEKLT